MKLQPALVIQLKETPPTVGLVLRQHLFFLYFPHWSINDRDSAWDGAYTCLLWKFNRISLKPSFSCYKYIVSEHLVISVDGKLIDGSQFAY